MQRPTPLPDARPNQSGRESPVVRLRFEGIGCAGCTAPVVVRLRANGMEITGTAPARRKQSSFGSSSNRFADVAFGGKADMPFCTVARA